VRYQAALCPEKDWIIHLKNIIRIKNPAEAGFF
jgi:hypothetical protein